MNFNRYTNLATNNYLLKKYPISLVHFVTNRCNARCSFCFIDFDDPKTFKGELSVDEIEKLSKNLGNSIQNINLTGGEPLKEGVKEISEIYIKNAKVGSLFITSNGSLPDRIEDYLNNLVPKYPDTKFVFSFSIDNIEDKHNKIRKIDNLFNHAWNLIRLFKNTGIMFMVIFQLLFL